ncbi:MAG: hypothetical protein LC775_19135, partial [Acidobacteria bacterium]|nr:hypothetical protein [Acidobacteriota bacterium]
TRRHGEAETWRCGDVEMRRRGDAETWRCGEAEMRRGGDGARRRWGEAEMRRGGDAARRRWGEAEMRRGKKRETGRQRSLDGLMLLPAVRGEPENLRKTSPRLVSPSPHLRVSPSLKAKANDTKATSA